MSAVHKLITDHLDIWTAADTEKKSGRGRASGNANSVYGIEKLRELILELAVRGKLVPQDPNEEPAIELLKRISADQPSPIQSKKNKEKEARFEGESLKESSGLPIGWTYAYIPQIVSRDKYAIKRGPFGSSIQKSHFVSSGYKVYEQQHAIKDDFSIGDYYVTKEKFEELHAFSVKPNDIIISCSGTVGRVAVAPSWIEPGIINQALLKLTLNENALTNAYFKILFPAFYMRTETLSNLKGTAQKNMVSVDELKNEPFPLPPHAEQHRIVAKVDELMALCDQLEAQHNNAADAHEQLVSHLLSTLTQSQDAADFNANWQRIATHFDTLFTTESSIDALKQTLLQLAVMGKLVPQDPNDEPASELLKRIQVEKAKLVAEGKIKKEKSSLEITVGRPRFPIPSTWKWVPMSELCRPISSGSTPPAESFNSEAGVPFLKVYNIREQEIDFEYKKQFISDSLNDTKLSRSILYPGDVVMNIVGPPLGKVAIIPDTYPRWNCNQALVFFGLIAPMSNKYVLNYLKEGSFLKDIELIGTAGQDNISVTKSKNILIPVPPISEQKRIIRKVDELMLLCDRLKALTCKSNTHKKTLANAVLDSALNGDENA